MPVDSVLPIRPNRRSFLIASAVAAGGLLWPRGARVAAAAQADLESQIDSMTERMLEQFDAPSAAVGVARDGSVLYTHGYGKIKLPDGPPPDADTVYFIGSLSKALTAVGAMHLVERGKLDLDQPIGAYIPNLPKSWQPITVKQVMCHTSGIPDIPRKDKVAAGKMDVIYQQMADQPLTFPPGSAEVYNNFNFAVVGNLIEHVSGEPYIAYMKENVFGPAGMTRTGIGQIDPINMATGYEGGENGVHSSVADIQPLGTPSGGLESTVTDLLKLGMALCAGHLLGPAAMEQMITPYAHFNATPGWFRRMTVQGPVVFKDGAAGGYQSFMAFVPSKGDVSVVLRNLQKLKTPIAPLCNRILHVACDIPLAGGQGG